jgi:hypothetical protein
MKKFSKILLISIFTSLIAGSIQSVSADHTLGPNGIFKTADEVNFVTITESEYKLHLQVVVRDADGKLISISESKSGYYIPHSLTDFVLDNKVGVKEIISIGNMKYEKFQIIDVPNFSQRATGLYPILSETPMELNIQTTRTSHDWITSWKIHYCADFTDLGHEFKCIPLFNSLTSSVSIAMDDIVTNQWTILRVLN